MTRTAVMAREGSASATLSVHGRAQRERILDAAEKCFIRSGFHAASMAAIAKTANMSAGLIYRYFASKSAIVKAIIDRHLYDEACEIIDQLESPADVVNAALDVYERWRRGDDPKMNAALGLELTAAATRDPEIAKATRVADEFIRSGLQEVLRRSARRSRTVLDAATLRGRAMMLQCVIDGLAMRAIREPNADRAAIKAALQRVVFALMKA